MTWLICTPAWGERHVSCFVDVALPAIVAALEPVGGVKAARFMVHTDAPDRIGAALADYGLVHSIYAKPVRVSKYYAMSDAHHEALARAKPDQRIALINADMVPSVECFAAAERRFAEGKQMIVMAATRTMKGKPPIGARSRDLLNWAWDHRHYWITDCIWGSGRSTCLSNLFFARNGSVINRAFHLHPFALIKQANQTFVGLTVDDGLVASIARDKLHVVIDADEMAFAEISPTEPLFKSMSAVIEVKHVVKWANALSGPNYPQRVSATHAWLFDHRIVLKGTDADAGDIEICRQIRERIVR